MVVSGVLDHITNGVLRVIVSRLCQNSYAPLIPINVRIVELPVHAVILFVSLRVI